MLRNAKTAKLGPLFALTLMLLPLAAGTAAADPQCRRVRSHLVIEADPTPECGSPIFLCATATVWGSLRATTDFVGLSQQVAAETEDGAVLAVQITGDNTFHTERGDFFTKDSIVLSTVGNGEFAEVDVVTGGTGDYAGATGVLTATGVFLNGTGDGIIEGEICVP